MPTRPVSPRYMADPPEVASAQPAATAWEALMLTPWGDPEPSTEERAMEREIIAAAVDELTDREWWAFHAHVYEHLSFAQIAAQLGISKAGAHLCFTRARGRLAVALSPLLEARHEASDHRPPSQRSVA